MQFSLSSFCLGGIPPEKWNNFANYFDHQSEKYANEVFIRYYTEENGNPEYVSLTYGQVNHIATNAACEWYTEIKNESTVAILLDHSSDLLISMLAVFKLRVPLLVISPRNSEAAISNLLRATKCNLLISNDKYTQVRKESTNNVKGCRFLSVPDLCRKYLSQPLNYLESSVLNKYSTDQDLDKIGLILHSSGTTGFPKPVYLKNKALLNQFIPQQKLKESGKSLDNGKDILFAGAPLFHSFGFGSFFSLLHDGSTAVFPKRLPPSQQDIEFALRVNKCNVMTSPPFILNEIIKYSKDYDITYIQNLRTIITGGASVTKDIGDWFHSKGVRIFMNYGLTEASTLMTNDRTSARGYVEELRPVALDPNGEPFCQFKPTDDDNDIKQLCVRGDVPHLANVKLNTDGFFETGDLFKESTQHPGWHIYIGRKDDTLIMLNGEKTNPVPMEQILNKSPVIKLSLIFGRGRQCTSVLLLIDDTATENMSDAEVMGHVKSAIHEANGVSPSHSAIVPQMVKILPSDTVLPVTPKGTFMRKKIEEMFSETLDQLYHDFLEGPEKPSKKQKTIHSTWNKRDTIQFLLQGAAEVLDMHIDQIETTRSLFDLGLNSLKSIQLCNFISTQFNVDNNFIFHHSSISSMYDGIIAEDRNWVEQSYRATEMILKRYLDKAEKEFGAVGEPVDRSKAPKVILLTGVTGSLGAFMLRQLLADSNVKKVYCVIRGDPKEMWSRLKKSFHDRSLDTSIFSDKERIEPISLDFMDDYFGLDECHFMKLKNEVTMVQHCGWLLDFNMPIEHFDRECIAPFYNLLKFSLQRKDPILVHFISSVSASAYLDPAHIQEVSLPLDSRVAMPMGYAQSKFVAELLLDFLSREKNLPCFIHRVGQMYGDTENGIWNYSEQFPLMFMGGALLLGAMPKLDTVIDWLPVDYAASIIVDIMSETYAGKTAQHIYHIVNPRCLQWDDILDILKSSGVDFTTVSLQEWIKMLVNSPNNPAVALISYYESMLESTGRMPIWQTEKTMNVSSMMHHVPLLDSKLFKKFLVNWKSVASL